MKRSSALQGRVPAHAIVMTSVATVAAALAQSVARRRQLPIAIFFARLAMADRFLLIPQALEALRSKDWVARAEALRWLQGESPAAYERLLARLGPDECVDGKDAAKAAPDGAIALGDRPRSNRRPLRQLTLDHFFAKRRR